MTDILLADYLKKNKNMKNPSVIKITKLLFLFSIFTLGCKVDSLMLDDLVTSNSRSSENVNILNSGFENNWTSWNDTDPSAISTFANTGNKSAKITDNGGKFEQSIDVDSNTNYVLSAYIFGKGRLGVMVDGEKYANEGDFTDWTEVSVNFNSGSNSYITIFGEYNGGTGRFDDFSIVKSNIFILNSGFENNWTNWNDTDPSAISTFANTGDKSAKITGNGGKFEQSIDVDSNTNYVLSAYIFGKGRLGVMVDGEKYANEGDFAVWTKVSVNFNSGPNSAITIFGEYNEGTGRFDDFSLMINNINPTPFDVLKLQERWKITLPKDDNGDNDADEIFIDSIQNDIPFDGSLKTFEDNNYFYTDGNWTYFKCPGDGETTGNSSNPRSELRQMMEGGATQENWDMTNNFTNTMEFMVKILQTSESRKLAFAQIHAESGSNWDDILRLQIQSDIPNAKVGDTGHIYIMGSGNDDAHDTIVGNYMLGQEINMKIIAQNSQYKVFIDNSEVFVSRINITSTGNYFKAGNYLQSVTSSGTSGEGIVAFKKILVY